MEHLNPHAILTPTRIASWWLKLKKSEDTKGALKNKLTKKLFIFCDIYVIDLKSGFLHVKITYTVRP